MLNDFQLHEQLKKDTYLIKDLSLSKLLLMNNSLFPWVILVPKRSNVTEIIDLNEEDRKTLIDEIALVSKIIKKVLAPDKLNIAALGNIVEQLHIHIITRYKDDSLWPKPVFGCNKQEYTLEQKQKIITKLQENFNG